MDRYPFFRPDGWIKSELHDFNRAVSDEERRLMLLNFGYDEAHKAETHRLFPDMPD